MPAAVGPYTIEKELGRGGMGVVYLARDGRLDRTVAIKALAASLASDPSRVARFRSEAKLVAQLNHPHIAQIHDVREEGGHVYLVLEYVDGESLAGRLSRGAMPLMEAMEICVQVARAVGAAHARGVVHRDLKPDNIRITPDGTAKVLDFGIAKALDQPAPADTERTTVMVTAATSGPATQAGAIVGTPGYMAPEQARGRGVEKRADIWALGCILFECLTGQRAFSGPTIADTLAATLISEPAWSQLPGETPAVIVSLLHRCLVKDAESRLGDVAEAAARLEEALGRGPSAATVLAAPPAKAAPNNLPRQFTAFIGRQDQLAALRPLVDRSPLVTLTGAGGCGKTRLALRLAGELLSEYPGGIHLVELAALPPGAQVAAAAAAARGLREEAGRTPEQVISESIGEQRAMLILDNCEHLRGPCAALARSLLERCPNLRIIATGREALGVPGEATWRVPSLALPPIPEAPRTPAPGIAGTPTRTGSRALKEAVDQYESVALFCDRARAVKPAFVLTPASSAAVAGICRRLDGIPLAIELAAARVKLLTPEQILARLDDRFRLLTSGTADVGRHQTLRATIDWSYAMLTAEESGLLRLLSVFAGGWTLESAVCVAGGDEFEVLEILTRLVDKSLVVVEEAPDGAECRYRLLETVRQYSGEKLGEAGESGPARDRHQACFLELAERAAPALQGPEAGTWLDRLEAEHENLLAAIGHGSGTEAPVRLAFLLGRYWQMRGYPATGRAALTGAIARAGTAPSPDTRAKALNVGAILAHLQGDMAAARKLQTEALEIYRQVGDRRGMGAALNNLGVVTWTSGDIAGAEPLFAEAVSISRELGNTAWLASNLSNLGTLARRRGDLEEARKLQQEALELYRSIGSVHGEAGLRHNLAVLAQLRGEAKSAAAMHAEALSVRKSVGDRSGLAESVQSIAGLVAATSSEASDAALAVEMFGAVERLRDEIGSPVPAFDRERYERDVASARASLQGDGRFEAAWAAGRERNLEDVLTAAAAWLDQHQRA
jgi:predicted ATPase/predicted Ser/Thr protein kinase